MDALQQVMELSQEIEQITDNMNQFLDSVPDPGLAQVQRWSKREFAEEVQIVGDKSNAKKAINLFDEGEFEKGEKFLLNKVGLSKEDFIEFCEDYVEERYSESLALFEEQETQVELLDSEQNRVQGRLEQKKISPRKAAIILGGPLSNIDPQVWRRAQKRAVQAGRCVKYFNITSDDIPGEIRTPEEFIEDIRELDKEVETVQKQIKEILGMNKKEILQRYESHKE